mmetsp:Transcript_72431/g.192575  ORF Transcript_72431/g.192575 Transcript_72431/m.192575 type:complete len:205 (+) Transcript_72431:915-1529(+)
MRSHRRRSRRRSPTFRACRSAACCASRRWVAPRGSCGPSRRRHRLRRPCGAASTARRCCRRVSTATRPTPTAARGCARRPCWSRRALRSSSIRATPPPSRGSSRTSSRCARPARSRTPSIPMPHWARAAATPTWRTGGVRWRCSAGCRSRRGPTSRSTRRASPRCPRAASPSSWRPSATWFAAGSGTGPPTARGASCCRRRCGA